MNANFLYSFSSVSILSIICLYLTENILKMPAAMGFLLAGILASPTLFNVSEVISKGNLLGDFGMLFLMFYIGMEFSYSRLKTFTSYVKPSFIIYGFSTIMIFSVFMILIYSGLFPFLQNKFFSIICIVLCLSMASTAVTMELIENSIKNQYITYTVITSLILQDVVVILLMLFTSKNIFQGSVVYSLLKQIILPLIVTSSYILLTENFLFKPLMKFLYKKSNKSILPIFSIFLVVISSYLATINGISQEFGVFVIGMLIGDTEYKYSIISDIKPFQDIFLGLFFLSIGASFNGIFFVNNFFLILKFFFIIFGTKLLGIWIPSWMLSNKFYKSILLTIKLSNFSEIIFIILNNLRKNNYLDDFNLNFFTSITILSFLMSPIFNKFVQNIFKKSLKSIGSNLKNSNYDVVVVGFTKSILPVIKMLEENEVNYVIIEKNLSKIALAKNNNLHIVYGDMFNNQMLSSLNFNYNTVVFINFSLMGHHVPNLINFRKRFHRTKLLGLANLESDSLAHRFNIEIISNPYLDQSVHVGKTILKNFNSNWSNNDLEIYGDDFKKKWLDKNFDK
jgi:Kef-type K+ transport system membrane component KefB